MLSFEDKTRMGRGGALEARIAREVGGGRRAWVGRGRMDEGATVVVAFKSPCTYLEEILQFVNYALSTRNVGLSILDTSTTPPPLLHFINP